MPDADYVNWGGTSFKAVSVSISSYPRAINVAYNALSPEPVITTSAPSGLMQVSISAIIVGEGETAAERKASLGSIYEDLRTNLDKAQTTLAVNGESFRAFRSDSGTVTYTVDEFTGGVVSLDVTVNALPGETLTG